jgi:hypothetical protein
MKGVRDMKGFEDLKKYGETKLLISDAYHSLARAKQNLNLEHAKPSLKSHIKDNNYELWRELSEVCDKLSELIDKLD